MSTSNKLFFSLIWIQLPTFPHFNALFFVFFLLLISAYKFKNILIIIPARLKRILNLREKLRRKNTIFSEKTPETEEREEPHTAL